MAGENITRDLAKCWHAYNLVVVSHQHLVGCDKVLFALAHYCSVSKGNVI
jgi:hypothetical protein